MHGPNGELVPSARPVTHETLRLALSDLEATSNELRRHLRDGSDDLGEVLEAFVRVLEVVASALANLEPADTPPTLSALEGAAEQMHAARAFQLAVEREVTRRAALAGRDLTDSEILEAYSAIKAAANR